MLSKREEERNEKILRGLLKLPPNRNCINCNSLGPQYVCINFWTFVCMNCSGIHREFTHRVKSVSMSKFTTQEIEALQKGGNQRARDVFLKCWDRQGMRLPSNSNTDKIREFIRDAYIRKKYADETAPDKPPNDMKTIKNQEEYRRPDSYHSFSQSPPYEHQYEDRRYGRSQTITVIRRRGSDQGLFGGTISSVAQSPSPTRMREHMHEERYSNNGGYSSRFSDYSSRSQSPNFQDSGRNSPNLPRLEEMLFENPPSQKSNRHTNIKNNFDHVQHSMKIASRSNSQSVDNSPMLSRSVTIGNATSPVQEWEHINKAPTSSIQTVDNSSKLSRSVTMGNATNAVQEREHNKAPASPSFSHSSTLSRASNQDLVSVSHVPPVSDSSTPATNSYANGSQQVTTTLERKPSADLISMDEGWANFDSPQPVESSSGTSNRVSTTVPPVDVSPKGSENASSHIQGNAQWNPFEPVCRPFTLTPNLSNVSSHLNQDKTSSQAWGAFGDLHGTKSNSFVNLPENRGLQFPVQFPSSEDFSNWSQKPAVNNMLPNLPSYNGIPTSSSLLALPPVASLPSSSSMLALPPTQQVSYEPKSTNPFASSYDLSPQLGNPFLDMRALQVAMPYPQMPNPFHGAVPQQWFMQNSATQGGSTYMERQPLSPNLPNHSPHASVASVVSRNPFA